MSRDHGKEGETKSDVVVVVVVVDDVWVGDTNES
jgi:hypothetical protein